MIGKFLRKTKFSSYADFCDNFQIEIPEQFNFAYDVVDAIAQSDPDRAALLWTDEHGAERRFSFSDLSRISDATASFLGSLGIHRGDRVMLILKRHWQFWTVMMALHKLGAAAIPATHLLTPKDIIYRCRKAGVKMIVAAGDAQIVAHIQEAAPRCPSLKALVSTGPVVPRRWHDLDTGVEAAQAFVRPTRVNSNTDTMLIYFTSGTSGEPKMVAHDFTYPLGHIVTAAVWHNLHPGSRHLTVADTGWGKAVWGKLYGQWIAGAEVFVYDFDKFVPADLLRQMQDYRITSFCAPPTVYRFLIREDMRAYDLSALEWCTTAGEAMNPSVASEWEKITGLMPREAFGQTETTLTIGTFPWLEPRPGSMGLPNPQYDIRLVDADMNEVAPGEQGEIVIKADGAHRPVGLFSGYLGDDALTRAAWHDGFYHTGDIAWRDADGYFRFVGRKDDVIKSSGYRIGPFEVESACMTHPAVIECAVTAVPDAIRGQVVKATIVLARDYVAKAGADLIKEIQNHVKRITAPYKYPRIVEFVKELPKTISGKIRHAAIREANAAGSSAHPLSHV